MKSTRGYSSMSRTLLPCASQRSGGFERTNETGSLGVWQDWTLSIGSFFFAAALVPSIRTTDKPAVLTSLITGSWLGVFTVVYGSLSLWRSVVATALTAVLWFVLAAQKMIQQKRAEMARRPGDTEERGPEQLL